VLWLTSSLSILFNNVEHNRAESSFSILTKNAVSVTNARLNCLSLSVQVRPEYLQHHDLNLREKTLLETKSLVTSKLSGLFWI
jgi:hypothetical protein